MLQMKYPYRVVVPGSRLRARARVKSLEIYRIISINFRRVDVENNIASLQMRRDNAHSYEEYGNGGGEGVGINATFNAVRLRAAIIEFTP